MNRRIVSLALFVSISIIIAGCSHKTPSDQSTETVIAPTQTHTSELTASLNPPSAQYLALTTDDLGDGWLLDAEKTDLNDSYYFDRGELGNVIIGTHTTTHEPMFDPALVDTVSMRGFSQRDQNLMLFLGVVVFKETSHAEEIAKEFLLNAGRDSDIPDENYTYQDGLIGDESILVSVRENPDDELPIARTLCFRKERVLVYVMSMGQLDDMGSSPAESEERLVELAKIIAARIP